MGTCQEASSIKDDHPANKGVHRPEAKTVGSALDQTSSLNMHCKQPVHHNLHCIFISLLQDKELDQD